MGGRGRVGRCVRKVVRKMGAWVLGSSGSKGLGDSGIQASRGQVLKGLESQAEELGSFLRPVGQGQGQV